MVIILKNFCNIPVAREEKRLVLLNAMSTSRPAPLLNVAMDTTLVIIVDVIRPVHTVLVIVLNCFIFLPDFHQFQFHK